MLRKDFSLESWGRRDVNQNCNYLILKFDLWKNLELLGGMS